MNYAQAHPSRTGLRALVQRRPVASFLFLAFAGMWLSLLPALLFDASVRLFSAIGSLVGLALPAFLVTAIISGRGGLRDLIARSLRWRVALGWYALAILGIPVAVLLIAATFLGSAPFVALTDRWTLTFTLFLPEIVIALVTIQLCEEIGWTGFVQHRLQGRQGALRASLVVALAFGLIHLPTYFVGGPITGEKVLVVLVQMLSIIIFAAFFRALITSLYNGSGQSVLIAALVHAAFNTVSSARLSTAFLPESAAMWLPLAAVAALALLAVIVTRGRLAFSPGNGPVAVRGRDTVPLSVQTPLA